MFFLSGVAERDSDELVSMVFGSLTDVQDFIHDLPGTYNILFVAGVKYEDIKYTSYVFDKYCCVCDEGIRIGDEVHTDEESGEDCHHQCCPTCEGGVS